MTAVRLLAVGGVVGAAAVRSHDDAGAGGEKNLPGGGDRVVTGLEGEGTVTGTDAREGMMILRGAMAIERRGARTMMMMIGIVTETKFERTGTFAEKTVMQLQMKKQKRVLLLNQREEENDAKFPSFLLQSP
mmetsp:Transcript_24916/g.34659  ORF Transcript_24916/g.34659 Transcript_24916/m.34659 type:complete len:132 (-) Transcript_24916:162-557(-)